MGDEDVVRKRGRALRGAGGREGDGGEGWSERCTERGNKICKERKVREG